MPVYEAVMEAGSREATLIQQSLQPSPSLSQPRSWRIPHRRSQRGNGLPSRSKKRCHPPRMWLLLTMPLVLYGIFRYIYLMDQKGEGAAPDETLLRDKPLLLCLFYNAPHWPWEGPNDKDLSDSLIGKDNHRNWLETGTGENYAAVVQGLDSAACAHVAKLVNRL